MIRMRHRSCRAVSAFAILLRFIVVIIWPTTTIGISAFSFSELSCHLLQGSSGLSPLLLGFGIAVGIEGHSNERRSTFVVRSRQNWLNARPMSDKDIHYRLQRRACNRIARHAAQTIRIRTKQALVLSGQFTRPRCPTTRPRSSVRFRYDHRARMLGFDSFMGQGRGGQFAFRVSGISQSLGNFMRFGRSRCLQCRC
jgi:hypothetical protein